MTPEHQAHFVSAASLTISWQEHFYLREVESSHLLGVTNPSARSGRMWHAEGKFYLARVYVHARAPETTYITLLHPRSGEALRIWDEVDRLPPGLALDRVRISDLHSPNGEDSPRLFIDDHDPLNLEPVYCTQEEPLEYRLDFDGDPELGGVSLWGGPRYRVTPYIGPLDNVAPRIFDGPYDASDENRQ